MVSTNFLSIQLICFLFLPFHFLYAKTSVLRLKTGMSSLSITSGDRLSGEKLNSMVNLTPSVLWDFPSFSSRFGIHYMMELNSPYGLTPMSGIGLSAYYHILGITTGYELTKDDVLFQKSKPGPYIYAGFTPVNININKFNTDNNTADNYFFSALINDISFGLGYDYPIFQNMTLSGEFILRSGKTVDSSKDQVQYSGWTVFLTLATSYF